MSLAIWEYFWRQTPQWNQAADARMNGFSVNRDGSLTYWYINSQGQNATLPDGTPLNPFTG
jgi:hypothetical protein